jgi:hypothetical protein
VVAEAEEALRLKRTFLVNQRINKHDSALKAGMWCFRAEKQNGNFERKGTDPQTDL